VLFLARDEAGAGDAELGIRRPLVAVPSLLTPHPSLLHVMSSGTGRRAALACGVETSPEEYEGRVSLGGASSDVGTVATTETGDGVRSRLHGARTTPGISPCARYARLVEMTGEEGAEGAFEACHPERSRGVSGHEWGVSDSATQAPSKRVTPSAVEGSPDTSGAYRIRRRRRLRSVSPRAQPRGLLTRVGDSGLGLQRPLVAVPLPFTLYPLPLSQLLS
jgi:hypothetical protein